MSLYEYRATIVSIYDGDTVTLDVDLGLRTWVRGAKYRLYGINAPELRSLATDTTHSGIEARDHLRGLLGFPHADGTPDVLTVRTHKDATEKYGRWLAELIRDDGVDVNQSMIADGYAVEYLL